MSHVSSAPSRWISRFALICGAAAGLAIASIAGAGARVCNGHAWIPTFGAMGGMNGFVRALRVMDDGSGRGPALYAGGQFTTAGDVLVNHVARWDGESWTPMAEGLTGDVDALEVFDDNSGRGPRLYSGGTFTTADGDTAAGVMKWDGSKWTPLEGGLTPGGVRALAVFDDGSGRGPALCAAGWISLDGVTSTACVVRWDGAEWSLIGNGLFGGHVNALAVFDDGSGRGAALHAAGKFTSVGGTEAKCIARWDGAQWAPLGGGVGTIVESLAVFDDGMGKGPALYAGGMLVQADGMLVNGIARWDGTVWSPLGSGVTGVVHAMTVFDDRSGGGDALYVGGVSSAGGTPVKGMAKWDGAAWHALEGVGWGVPGTVSVQALTAFDDGSGAGAQLHAGGMISLSGGAWPNVVKWNGSGLTALGHSIDGIVFDLTVFDDGSGSGPALYAAGGFTEAGDVQAKRIAKWDGATWTPLGTGIANGSSVATVNALAVYDDRSGGGPALYAGGLFTTADSVTVNHIARWDGAHWTPLGSGMDSSVHALEVFDDGSGAGPALYAGGNFTSAGGVAANYIAKWDGTEWASLGSGMGSYVRALTVFDNESGGGPSLYVGGSFSSAGGILTHSIARWDGREWSAMDHGITGGSVSALTVFDDGSGRGPALYAGGQLYSIDIVGGTYGCVARWEGTSWKPLGSGVSGVSYPRVNSLAVFDDGSANGAALYAGGRFTIAGGTPARCIARWDGTSWSSVYSESFALEDDDGVLPAPTILTIAGFDDGSGHGAALYAGGHFTTSPAGDSFLAKWGCDEIDPPCAIADIDCDGVVDGTDLAVILGSWGTCGSPPCAADLNGDGEIDGSDLAILLGAWG